ncbi:hypothetical protein EDB81DRAFT_871216 [Dactylonectria macrodidyma]|uniref:N-acetyltransferase domain-containing protein n=1 Tax=Dactylonectria macrodidyma TaxID=307937 RepID=A0A9P9IVF8_9HYPO|nr:hypothetical protein EDB81DRAFT_871216 [Dactylonectria macrodidyma]
MATSTRLGVSMRPLGFDSKSVAAAAETLSLSFSSDPLISWLYRDAAGPRWSNLLPAVQRWQGFRVRDYLLGGIGMEAVVQKDTPTSVGVCFLFPPRSQYRWLRPWWWGSYLSYYWDLVWNRPHEPLADEKRIAIMFEHHFEGFKRITSQYPPGSVYYLEIAAVRPDAQGLGVGGKIMEWVVQRVGDSHCFLECTDLKNVPFYEKYGFKLIDEARLEDEKDPDHATTFYYMAKITCEGYGTRLTWGPTDLDAPTEGILLNPVRPSRLEQRTLLADSTIECTESIEFGDTVELEQVWSPDSQLDMLYLQHGPDSAIGTETPGDEVSKKLMENFVTSGHLTLTGRSGQGSVLMSDIVPLCDTSTSLRQTCLAYQASLEEEARHLTPIYLQSALSGYFEDLARPEKLELDATLATGVLLCSVSISSLYIWTPLMKGLRAVLQHRGLLSNAKRPPLADHLVEVIALLDIPYFTLNRISQPMNLWAAYVAPSKKSGVEHTSGLPYTMINLLDNLESPTTEKKLLEWTGELGEVFIQIHIWEAFRMAAILHSRALRSTTTTSSDPEALVSAIPSQALIRMKTFAAIQAVVDSGAFTFRQPFGGAIIYPLFIASLFTEEKSKERRLAGVTFHHLKDNDEGRNSQVAWDIVQEVWSRAKSRVGVCRLALAKEFAAEMKIELYLY